MYVGKGSEDILLSKSAVVLQRVACEAVENEEELKYAGAVDRPE
jgi:hypothetical protein